MAGRNHHYVWQLLQRGFGVEKFRKYHIWVFEKSKSPRQTTTDNFGFDKYFYGPEGSVADTNITNFENQVQGLVQQWRGLPDGTAVAKEQVLPIIALLETRSAFLRSEFEIASADLLQNTRKNVSRTKNVHAYLNKGLERFSDEIDARLREANYFGLPKDTAKEIVESYLRKRVHSDPALLTEPLMKMVEHITDNIKPSVKRAQNAALETPFPDMARAKLYSALEFSVMRTQTPFMILPDTSLAFLTDKGCRPFADKHMQIDFCLVPLASDSMLVGKRVSSDTRSAETFRRALASCAYAAFIAIEDAPDHRRLARLIGKNAKLLSNADKRRVSRKINHSLLGNIKSIKASGHIVR